MNPRSRLLLAATALGAAVSLAPAATAAAAPAPTSNLYLQQAQSGVLRGSTLVLRGVAPRTTTFTDRPQRVGSAETTRAFASGFARTFGADPPNAALEVTDAPASRDVALLELRRPRYDAHTHTLTYRVRRLTTTKSPSLHSFVPRADRGVTTFGRASLFIDSGTVEAGLLFTVTAPAAGTVGISPSNGTFDFNAPDSSPPGSQVDSIQEPANQVGQTGVGGITLGPSALTVVAGQLGPISVQLLVSVVVPASGTLTGTASLPAGATVTVQGGPGPVTLTNGPFRIPLG